MRIALLAIMVLVGANLGLTIIDKMTEIQDAKMERLCNIDESLLLTTMTYEENRKQSLDEVIQEYIEDEKCGPDL